MPRGRADICSLELEDVELVHLVSNERASLQLCKTETPQHPRQRSMNSENVPDSKRTKVSLPRPRADTSPFDRHNTLVSVVGSQLLPPPQGGNSPVLFRKLLRFSRTRTRSATVIDAAHSTRTSSSVGSTTLGSTQQLGSAQPFRKSAPTSTKHSPHTCRRLHPGGRCFKSCARNSVSSNALPSVSAD
jgi:hypothetical protein